MVVVHPKSDTAYEIVTVPAVKGVTSPAAETVAIAKSDDDHVPSGVAFCKVKIVGIHTDEAPVISATVGTALIVKVEALLPVVFGPTTVTTPLLTPAGSTAEIEVLLFTVNEAAATPLKRTAVAPVKATPVMVTVCPPALPHTSSGEKLVTDVGGGVKVQAKVNVPVAVLQPS